MFIIGGRNVGVAIGPYEAMGLTIFVLIGGLIWAGFKAVASLFAHYQAILASPEGPPFVHAFAAVFYHYGFVWPIKSTFWFFGDMGMALDRLIGVPYSILAFTFAIGATAILLIGYSLVWKLSCVVLRSPVFAGLFWLSPFLVSLAVIAFQAGATT